MANTMEKEVVIELYNNNTRQAEFLSACFFNFFNPSIFSQAEIMEINIKALESLLVRAKSSLRNKLVKREGV